MKWSKILYRLLAAAVVAGLAWLLWDAFQPQPIAVESATVTTGPLETTVNEEGFTRARDRFVLSAPITGRLSRITLREGDTVRASQIVATILPTPLDPVARRELEEKLRAANAVRRQLNALYDKAQSAHQQATRDTARAARLAKDGDIPQTQLEKTQIAETAAAKETAALRAQLDASAADIRSLQAALDSQQPARTIPVPIPSPIAGRIFQIPEKSERQLRSGDPILTLSNARQLEIVVEALSSEAVHIRPGMPARIVNYGAPEPLPARVRTIEPAAFKKISALGVEERRVNVILDFLSPPESLGDGYQLEARIVTWSSPNVTKLPTGALFRCADAWCVYTIDANRARRLTVSTGHRSATEAELLSGLPPAAPIILHPPNSLTDGSLITVLPSR